MANKNKRSRAQAASATGGKCAALEQQSKKKPKFSKTLSSDIKLKPSCANNAQVKESNARMAGQAPTDTSSSNGMKKKSKKKKKKKNSGASIAAGDVTAATSKKAKKATEGSEIDNLFESLKTEKQKKNMEEEQQLLAEKEEARRQKKEKERLQQQIKKLEAQNTNSSAAGLNPDPRPVRYDEDGLPIYTESSLQIGKGGSTKDCPFDCWCCF